MVSVTVLDSCAKVDGDAPAPQSVSHVSLCSDFGSVRVGLTFIVSSCLEISTDADLSYDISPPANGIMFA